MASQAASWQACRPIGWCSLDSDSIGSRGFPAAIALAAFRYPELSDPPTDVDLRAKRRMA